MADYLDTLGRRLVDAARRLGERRRRRRRRAGAASVLAVLVVGPPALAATGVWHPPIGNGRDPAPSVTAEAPPADQLALLGVLRREQTEADRGAATLAALRLIGGRSIEGIRADSIRLLAEGPRDAGLVLVPAVRYMRMVPRLPADAPPELRARMNRTIDDALCLFQLDKVDGAGVVCWSSDDVRAGTTWMSLGHRKAWLVPDGVARVRTEYPDAPAVEAAVRDNLALFSEPRGRPGEPTTTFLDADGGIVRMIEPTKPPAPEQLPVAPGSTHSGGVRGVTVRGRGLDARYVLRLVQPKRRPPAFIYLTLERPACAGKRHVSELVGAISGRRFGAEIHPSIGDFHRARWCPGTYRGSYRFKGGRRPWGTFSFRVVP